MGENMSHALPFPSSLSFSPTISINAEKQTKQNNVNFYKEEFTILRHVSLVRQTFCLILSKSGTLRR